MVSFTPTTLPRWAKCAPWNRQMPKPGSWLKASRARWVGDRSCACSAICSFVGFVSRYSSWVRSSSLVRPSRFLSVSFNVGRPLRTLRIWAMVRAVQQSIQQRDHELGGGMGGEGPPPAPLVCVMRGASGVMRSVWESRSGISRSVGTLSQTHSCKQSSTLCCRPWFLAARRRAWGGRRWFFSIV